MSASCSAPWPELANKCTRKSTFKFQQFICTLDLTHSRSYRHFKLSAISIASSRSHNYSSLLLLAPRSPTTALQNFLQHIVTLYKDSKRVPLPFSEPVQCTRST